jgi:hypothetical protein
MHLRAAAQMQAEKTYLAASDIELESPDIPHHNYACSRL